MNKQKLITFKYIIEPKTKKSFRKSPFCTCHFHKYFKRMLLVEKKFQFYARVQKWHFGKIVKMALMNPCMKFEIFFDQKLSFEALHR